MRFNESRCMRCRRKILYDADSGYWIHAGFEIVDGHNGLYCSPDSWNPNSSKYRTEYAEPDYKESARKEILSLAREYDIHLEIK